MACQRLEKMGGYQSAHKSPGPASSQTSDFCLQLWQTFVKSLTGSDDVTGSE